MKINSLEVAESIVEDNDSLQWNGWDIIHYAESPAGWAKTNGAFRNDKWFVTTAYPLTAKGWELPSRFVRDDAK